jgi:tetratricopeptide (TPR) repeat protein
VVEDESNLMILMTSIKNAIRSKQWRAADTLILEYLRRVPNNPDALMYLGISKAGQGYEPEGEHHLLASLTFNPRNKVAYYYLGVIVMEQGRCILASEAFRKGLDIDPDNHSLHYQLGRALERLGNHEEALQAYEQVLNTDPSMSIDNSDFITQSQEAIARLQDPEGLTDTESCED